MVASLARLFGSARLDLAEEVVQDALARALATWPYQGVPQNPAGWLFDVARNRARDILRRETSFAGKAALLEASEEIFPTPAPEPEACDRSLDDDELAMIFMCCHRELPEAARIALTLKTVGGFGVEEIAAALLTRPAAIAQRLVRAKRVIRQNNITIEIPAMRDLGERLDDVLEVIYLIFTEGYRAHRGDDLVRGDLCEEAIRLAELLTRNEATHIPKVHALLALMLLQAARLPARADRGGDLLLLDDQDRSLWAPELIAAGLRHFDLAAAGRGLTPYHLEAAIAAHHAAGQHQGETDWRHVLQLYDELLELKPSPVVALNRAIALSMVEGPAKAIRTIEEIAEEPAFATYHLLPSVLGALWFRAGSPETAANYYRAALAMPSSAPVRRFLQRQLCECERKKPLN
jgi:RNA polymerase sigma-70 factor (ECF subfamily)